MEIPYIVTPRKDTGLFNSKVGIWLFLASEVMLFGGFFSAYVFLRLGADYPWPERTLPVLPGLLNTFILIASSVTVVFAWAALKMRQWARFQFFMGITVACAAIFMVFKGIEYNVKFHHHAVRMHDYTVLEGHLGYLPEGGHPDEHAEHGGEAGEVRYATNFEGDKIEENTLNFSTSTVTYNITRYHKPWIRELLFEAGEAQVAIGLAEEINLNREDAENQKEDLVFKEGEPLSFELLGKIQKIHLDHRAKNADWRTQALQESWKQVKAKPENALSEANFASEFPKALSMDGAERSKAFVRWKAGKRSRMAEQVGIAGIEIKGQTYGQVELPEQATVKFKVAPALTVRHRGKNVITKYAPEMTQVSLRDGTVLDGKVEASPMVFHYVDGIDFQHLVMKAEEWDQDPIVAISNSWVIKNSPEIASIWEKHQKAVGQLEAELTERYGFEEDGKTPKRVPTEKDRYRMGWQEIAYYGETALEDVNIEKGKLTAPRKEESLKEEFTGPDYKGRVDAEGNSLFPHISLPREQVLFDSKFNPAWNNYYGIYFAVTGLHGLHVIGGAIVLAYYLFFGKAMYRSNPEWLANRVEVGGLFWHFVDLVWIFAFPIFYLM